MPTNTSDALVTNLGIWAGAFAFYFVVMALMLFLLHRDEHYSRKQLATFASVMLIGFAIFFIGDVFFGQTWGF